MSRTGAPKLRTFLRDYYVDEIWLMSDKWCLMEVLSVDSLSTKDLNKYLVSSRWKVRNGALMLLKSEWEKIFDVNK